MKKIILFMLISTIIFPQATKWKLIGYELKPIESKWTVTLPTGSKIPTPFTVGTVSVTATGTELNYVRGVTSAIQTQLGNKQGALTNSAGLASALSDETGTGSVVFNSQPTLLKPKIGTHGAVIDSAKVVADTLFFYSGSYKYKAVK